MKKSFSFLIVLVEPSKRKTKIVVVKFVGNFPKFTKELVPKPKKSSQVLQKKKENSLNLQKKICLSNTWPCEILSLLESAKEGISRLWPWQINLN